MNFSKIKAKIWRRGSSKHSQVGPEDNREEEIQGANEIMGRIYKHKLWGGKKYDYYSGFGSHSKKVVKPYVKTIGGFLKTHEKQLAVCDLGCGDFNVGNQLVEFSESYIGVDVVPDLVERNKKQFQNSKLSFTCLDIINDDLPFADCVLVRQVLQHLSNSDILKLAAKLQKYSFAIVTEHLPKKKFVPNLDKLTGANIRLSNNSGVVLHEAPFSIPAKQKEELLRIKYNKGLIVTTLYQF